MHMVMTSANSINTCLKYGGTQSRDICDHILENRCFWHNSYFVVTAIEMHWQNTKVLQKNMLVLSGSVVSQLTL